MDAEEERLRGGHESIEPAPAGPRLPDPGRWSARRWIRVISPHSVSAVDLDGSSWQLAEGARFATTFVPTLSWRADAAGGSSFEDLQRKISGRVVHVSAPEDLVIRRMFHVPTHSPREIEQMLHYQLAPGLPIPLRELYWCWRILESSDVGSRVLVELVRRDALEQRLAPLIEIGAAIDRALPEAWLLAHRVRELTSRSEASGLFLRSDGVMLVVQNQGRYLFSSRLLPHPIRVSDADASSRRAMQQELETALDRARAEFEFHFDRALPEIAIVVAEPARTPQDHEAEVIVSNALGAEPAGARVHDEQLPWRGVTLAALASEPGPSLVPAAKLQRARRRRVLIHATVLGLASLSLLFGLARLDLRRLERAQQGIQSELAEGSGEQVDLAMMQDALRDAAAGRAGDFESLRALLTVRRHATTDFALDRYNYLAGEKVLLSGSAQGLSSIVTFAQKLEAEPLFSSATVQGLYEFVQDDKTRTRFEIEARLTP